MGSIQKHLRIGVDVGGTNTDAVVFDPSLSNDPNRVVLAVHKTPTTSPNVTDGIETAVQNILEQSKIDRNKYCISRHWNNPFRERHFRERLQPIIESGDYVSSKCFTEQIPPFSDFPPALKQLMYSYYCFDSGGLHIDGSGEAPIVKEQIIPRCHEVKQLGIEAIVISGVFSPINEHFEQEHHVCRIIQRELPEVGVVFSSEVSNMASWNERMLRFSMLQY